MEEEKKAPEPKPQAEKVDGQCYICFTPMVEPCTMECGHSFCMNCLRDFWKYKRECPMCRAVPSQKFQINCDKKLQLKIKKAEPKAFAEKETELRAANQLQGDWAGIDLIFGNRHETVAPKKKTGIAALNTHKWTAFIKFADKKIGAGKVIEKVRFGLHPSFGVDHFEVKKVSDNGCFECTFTGFAPFEVPITITFRRGLGFEPTKRVMTLNHVLSFEGKGAWKRISLPIKKADAKKAGIPVKSA